MELSAVELSALQRDIDALQHSHYMYLARVIWLTNMGTSAERYRDGERGIVCFSCRRRRYLAMRMLNGQRICTLCIDCMNNCSSKTELVKNNEIEKIMVLACAMAELPQELTRYVLAILIDVA